MVADYLTTNCQHQQLALIHSHAGRTYFLPGSVVTVTGSDANNKASIQSAYFLLMVNCHSKTIFSNSSLFRDRYCHYVQRLCFYWIIRVL